MLKNLPGFVYPLVGILGLVAFTLLGMWLLVTGWETNNSVMTGFGYAVAVVGVLPALLITSPPTRAHNVTR